jgi:hypothetical protein
MSEQNTGTGAPGRPKRQIFGLGSVGACACESAEDPSTISVHAMLGAGSPRLALAIARGVPFAPYMMNIRAVFPDTSTSIVPNVGADVKISQDTLIDSMVYRIQNESITANQNTFQAQSDFYYNIQSGIEATLSVQGAPRYEVAPTFTPLATLADFFNGDTHWPKGWVLNFAQQLIMSFNAKVVLPTAPLEVIVSFRGRQPVTQGFVTMSNREAISSLQTEFGLDIAQSYIDRVCAL